MLLIEPCIDSDEIAGTRRRELNVFRHVGAQLGRTAAEAAHQGYYVNDHGDRVNWGAEVQAACEAKVSIAPTSPLPVAPSKSFAETRVQVTNETTLQAALRLVERGLRPLALNFANGIEPGGGFLGGARAQEEVLCRSSALYATLVGDAMYQHHRGRPLPDSTDWAIYSPDVPVFRSDAGRVLDKPWLLSFVTCAAPYAPAVGQPTSRDLLRARIRRVLEIGQAYGHETLVLGAWGCGAFGNDPHHTAADFREALEAEFDGAFSDVVFAITDWSPGRRFLGAFRDVSWP
ncbi:MAG: TIGR02452 family protein [Chromatiaceae bacterium]|nr:TIGR02452 family protein [Chromatiaceae bacterium]HPE81697.1 TIGR02452 family protein [Gammaproteobacteria bacterium]